MSSYLPLPKARKTLIGARALSRNRHKKVIRKHSLRLSQVVLARANSKWKAATWYAERRDQQRYGGNRLNINVVEKNISSEELLEKDAKALVALIAKVE